MPDQRTNWRDDVRNDVVLGTFLRQRLGEADLSEFGSLYSQLNSF